MNINSILVLGKKESKKDSFLEYIYDGNYKSKKSENYNGEISYKDSVYIKDSKVNLIELIDLTKENVGVVRKKAIDEINKGEAYSNINNRIHSVIYCLSAEHFEEFELEELIKPLAIEVNKLVLAITDCKKVKLEQLELLEKKLAVAVSYDEIIRLDIENYDLEHEEIFVAERKDAMRAITINMWERLRIRALSEAFNSLNDVVEQWKKYCDNYVHDKVNPLNVKKTKINSEKIFTDMLNEQLKEGKIKIEKNLKEYLDYFNKVDINLNCFVDDEYHGKHRDVEIVYPSDLTATWTGDPELDAIPEGFKGKATKERILEDINDYYSIVKRQIAIIMETYKNVLA